MIEPLKATQQQCMLGQAIWCMHSGVNNEDCRFGRAWTHLQKWHVRHALQGWTCQSLQSLSSLPPVHMFLAGNLCAFTTCCLP